MNLLNRWISNRLRARGYKLQRIAVEGYDEASVFREVFAGAGSVSPLVVDVGSHKGLFIDQVLAAAPSAGVVGFEPIPELHTDLERKFSGHGNVRIRNSAAGAEIATRTF